MSIPKTMKAVQIVAFNKPYEINQVPVPTPKGRDILIKIGAASYCHTDYVTAAGDFPGTQLPQIPSHEGCGTVAALGPDVPSGKLRVGDRVAVAGHYHPCLECDDCKNTGIQYCDFKGGKPGITMDGSLAEYLLADSHNVLPLPDELDFTDAAPLMCAGLTIYSAFKNCNLKPGDWVAVSGAGGGLGHLGIQFGKALGYHVVGIDNRDSSIDLIRSLNCCDLIVDARKETTAEVFKKCNNGLGVDAVLILPESQKAFDYAAPLARKAGTVCIVSFPANGFNISSNEVVFRDVRIRGTLLGTTKEAQEMFDVFVKNKLKVVKTIFTLDQVNELVKAYESGNVSGKLVVKL